jgi:hypothetical protein
MNRSSSTPDPGAFLNPWDHGSLIRYLAWHRQAHASLPVPAPRGGSGGLVPLSELYIPPRLGPSPAVAGKASATVDLFDLFDLHRRIVLLSPRGGGRSTLAAELIHALTDPTHNPVIDRLGRMVPLWFPLRRLAVQRMGRTVEALLSLQQGRPWWYPGLDSVLLALLDRGQVLFVLDGYDEVEDRGAREALRDAILDGMWRFPSCTWLITADAARYGALPLREEVSPDEDLPPSLATVSASAEVEVPAWHIHPFDAHQVRAWSERWTSLRHLTPEAEAAEGRALAAELEVASRRLGSRLPCWLPLLALAREGPGGLSNSLPGLLDQLRDVTIGLLGDASGLGGEARRRFFGDLAARSGQGDGGVPQEEVTELARAAARATHEEDPGEVVASTFVELVLERAPFLDATDRSVRFCSAELQVHLAAGSIARSLQAEAPSAQSVAALKGWARRREGAVELGQVFEQLAADPAQAEKVYTQLLGGGRRQTLADMDALGPLAQAIRDHTAVPDKMRTAAHRLVGEAIRRWATDRGRVPPWTRDLRPLAALEDQVALSLADCAEIVDLGPISHLRQLSRLDLHGCVRVTDLSPLAFNRKLQWMDARGCVGIEHLEPLGSLSELRWLDLGGCTAIKDLEPLSRLPNLQALALHGCHGLRDLTPLSALRGLRALILSDCPQVTDLSPLRRLPSGGRVWVKGTGIKRAPPTLEWAVIGLDV